MKKQKYQWLDRRISAPGPYLALCLSEDEYLHAMQHMGVKSPPPLDHYSPSRRNSAPSIQ